jgi:hypothetical protein
MAVPFDQIPESVWETVTWFATGDNPTPPGTAAVRAAVGLGLLYGAAVNWALRQLQARRLPDHWSRVWITNLGMLALAWRDEHRPIAGERGQTAEQTSSEQLPVAGTKFREEDVPADFREGGRPDGAVLTSPYLARSTNWLLNTSYLTKHFGPEPDKELKNRIKVGSAYAYRYVELLILRDHKDANAEQREEHS